jgi:hypothetical protein
MLYFKELRVFELIDLIKVELVSCDNELHILYNVDMLEVITHENFYSVVVTYRDIEKESEVFTVTNLSDIDAYKMVKVPLSSQGQIKIM